MFASLTPPSLLQTVDGTAGDCDAGGLLKTKVHFSLGRLVPRERGLVSRQLRSVAQHLSATTSVSGDTTPCKMTGLTLHGFVSPECLAVSVRARACVCSTEVSSSSLLVSSLELSDTHVYEPEVFVLGARVDWRREVKPRGFHVSAGEWLLDHTDKRGFFYRYEVTCVQVVGFIRAHAVSLRCVHRVAT